MIEPLKGSVRNREKKIEGEKELIIGNIETSGVLAEKVYYENGKSFRRFH